MNEAFNLWLTNEVGVDSNKIKEDPIQLKIYEALWDEINNDI